MKNVQKAEIANRIIENYKNTVDLKGIDYFYTPEKFADTLEKYRK